MNSEIHLEELEIDGIQAELFFYGKTICFILKNCFFKNLNNPFISLEGNSNVSIYNSKFLKLTSLNQISNFFEFENCLIINITNNNFEECSNTKGTCIELKYGGNNYKINIYYIYIYILFLFRGVFY